MSFETLIAQHGYWALLIGTALEGETILVVAGYLAHRGYLQLPYVVCVAAAGTFVGDQTFFQIGRRSGAAFLRKRPHWQARAERVHGLLNRHRIGLVMGFRFMYGLRTVSPFVIGMSGFGGPLFMLLNAISASIWAVVVASAGYIFGQILERWLDDAKRFERPILIGLLCLGLVTWLIHSLRAKRRTALHPGSEP